MRLLLTALTALAAITTMTAAASLDERIAGLNGLAARRQPVSFDLSAYQLYVQEPRNYSLILLFTTSLAEHNCKPCQQVLPEYTALAQSWSRSSKPSQLYFGLVDVKNSPDLFRELKIETAPVMLYVPPTIAPHAAGGKSIQKSDMLEFGLSVNDLVDFVQKKTGIKVPIHRPFDYVGLATTVGAIALAAITLYLLRDIIIKTVSNKYIWAFVSIGIIIIMCSGYMWNTIRKPPFVGQNEGKMHLVSGGSQYQFAVETDIVAILYALASLSFTMLILYVPYISKDSQSSSFITLISIFVMTYSLIVSIFGAKLSYYPFRLLF